MLVVSFALALPVVLLVVALLTYLLARALLLIGPPGSNRHRPPTRRHPSPAHDPGSHAAVSAGCACSLPVVQVVEAAAGGLPAVGHEQTRHRPSMAFGSPALARPGQGKNQGANHPQG
jgi:hypothetical protein